MSSDAFAHTLDLVQQAQAGDRPALEALFERYYDRVTRAVRARIGAKLRARVETGDVMQRTFLKAFEKFDRFEMRDEASFLHWLATLAERQILELVEFYDRDKRSAVREVRPVTTDEGAGAGGMRSLPDTARLRPDRLVEQDERARRLEEALDELPQQQRDLIVLREFLGMSWGDVAAQTGRASADAARVAFATAMSKLTVVMRGQGS